MATGLIALLDDIAAIAKVAAASLDDIAAQTVKARSESGWGRD
jgi:predicted DNA repair protein MutK